MASATKKSKVRRILKKVSAARKRKNYTRKYGSTVANLPLNKPTANDLMMAGAAQ